ncbi:MAG TPA: hypothetical protein VFK34_10875 [Marmoricola sp.]|jgi:hypothetical protein|nr:hypothetical protein [Marmoricola sp.]
MPRWRPDAAPYTRRMHPRYRRMVITGLLVGLIVIVVVATLLG